MTKTRKTLRKQKQQKQQKLWNMKGCSRKNKKSMSGGGCGCGNPFFGGNQRGGGCGCGASFLGGAQTGGMKMGGSEPALIGTPWTANISTWPGVAGNAGQSNFFSLNKYTPFSPETQMEQERIGAIFPPENVKYLVGGGKRGMKSKSKRTRKHRILRNRNKKMLKGGSSFIGQQLINTGRSIQFGLGSAYNTLSGYPLPVDPQPFSDQYTKNPYMNIKPV
jgi:hypothetical protein